MTSKSPGGRFKRKDWPELVDWLEQFSSWTSFLRGHDFRLSVGDDLVIAELSSRLKQRRIRPSSPEEAAIWFGPAFCRDADDQKRLPDLLRAWAENQAPAQPSAKVEPVIEDAMESQRFADQARSHPWRLAIVGAAFLVVTFLGFYAVLRTPGQAPQIGVAPPQTQIQTQTLVPSRVWAAVGAAVACSTIAGAWYWLQRRRRAALTRGLAPTDARKMALRIQLRDLALFRPDALKPVLTELRRHRYVEADWIDGAASARATLSRGGFAELVHGQRPETPDHLLLVDLSNPNDILGVLAELIADRLRSGQTSVERFDFRGDPQRLTWTGRQRAVALEELQAEFPRARLLVLSDLGSVAPPGSDRLAGWTEDLRAWNEVVFLTPLPLEQWSLRERTLIRRGFYVTRATPGGLAAVVRVLGADLPADRATPGGQPLGLDLKLAANPYHWLGDSPPRQSEVAALLSDLEIALDDRAMLYFCALAVFPKVHPKLTVALGLALGDEDGQPILSESTLAQLSRLPWLREGRIPDWLRLALVNRLRTSADWEERALAAWTRLLTPEQGNSPAGTSLTLQVARSIPADLPALIAGLLREEPGPYREAILLAFLNRDDLPDLAVELPDALARLLRPASPWSSIALASLGVGLAAAIFAFGGLYLDRAQQAISGFVTGIEDYAVRNLRVYLEPASILSSLAALGLWYVPSEGRNWRRMALGSAILGLIGILIATVVATGPPKGNMWLGPGALLWSVWVIMFLTRARRGDGWAPLIVAIGFANFWSMPLRLTGDDLQWPLILWLASRKPWVETRRLLMLCSPVYLFRVALVQAPDSAQLYSNGNSASLLALAMAAYFVKDEEGVISRTFDASQFGWGQVAILFIPYGIGLSVVLGSLSLTWAPDPVFSICCLAVGFSRVRWSHFFTLMYAFIFFFILISHTQSPLLWSVLRWDGALRIDSALFWIGALPTAVFFFMCGKLGRGLFDGEASAPSLLMGFTMVATAVAVPHLNVGSPVLVPYADWISAPLIDSSVLLAAAPLLGAIAPRFAGAGAILVIAAATDLLGQFVGGHTIHLASLGGWRLDIDPRSDWGEAIAATGLAALAASLRDGNRSNRAAVTRASGFVYESESSPHTAPVPFLEWQPFTRGATFATVSLAAIAVAFILSRAPTRVPVDVNAPTSTKQTPSSSSPSVPAGSPNGGENFGPTGGGGGIGKVPTELNGQPSSPTPNVPSPASPTEQQPQQQQTQEPQQQQQLRQEQLPNAAQVRHDTFQYSPSAK